MALEAPFEVSIRLRFKPWVPCPDGETLLRALKVLGLCGGMGGRSRHGFGSLTLTSLQGAGVDGWEPPKDAQTLADEIVQAVGLKKPPSGAGSPSSSGSLPPFTAFSLRSKVLTIAPGSRNHADPVPLDVLDALGREMVRFRSWGRNGTILQNIPSEVNFEPDHDLMKNRRTTVDYPARSVFGLPHNYLRQPLEKVEPTDFDRRASPLFFHLHQPDPAAPALAVVSLLPATFLPGAANQISVGDTPQSLNPVTLWKPVEDFMDRLTNKGKAAAPPRRTTLRETSLVKGTYKEVIW